MSPQPGQEVSALTDAACRLIVERMSQGYIVTFDEINARKDAERLASLSEARFHALFDLSPDPITLNRWSDGALLEANQAFCTLTGIPREEALGHSPASLGAWVRAEDRDLLMAELGTQGATATREARFRDRNGEERDLLVTARGVSLEGEQVVIIHAKDLTEHRKSEERLRQTHERLTRQSREQAIILETANVGFSRVVDRKQVWVNAWMEKTFGYRMDEMVGQTTRMLYWDEASYEQLGREAYARLAKGETFETVRKLRSKSGQALWIHYNGRAIDSTDLNQGTLWVLVDHTQLHEAEQALLKINQELEQRVTAELAQRLSQERMLIHQARLAAMGDMIGNIAHQWRQPLSSLAMLLGNLKDARRFNQLTDEYLETSFITGDRLIQNMSTTITDFMAFFRPDKEAVRFSLRAQTEATIRLVLPLMGRDHVEVVLEEGGEAWTLGFPNEFSQVILNLLANAREAILASGAANGRIQIRIAAEGHQATLLCSDNGGGIRIAPIERIFEPYLTDKPSGTGLGLYMSRMILEQSMSGTITVQNIPGGAAFRIALPLTESSHEHR